MKFINLFNRDFLKNEYIFKEKSIQRIAKENDTYYSKVWRDLIKFNIPIRSHAESYRLRINREGRHFNKGRIPWNKDIPHSEETKQKIGKSRTYAKGEKHPLWGKFGENHPGWKKNCITPENIKIRQSHEFKEWRKAVFERDNYTCVRCLEYGGDKHAHHIIPFAIASEERFEIDNGATLCKDCHKYVHLSELQGW